MKAKMRRTTIAGLLVVLFGAGAAYAQEPTEIIGTDIRGVRVEDGESKEFGDIIVDTTKTSTPDNYSNNYQSIRVNANSTAVFYGNV